MSDGALSFREVAEMLGETPHGINAMTMTQEDLDRLHEECSRTYYFDFRIMTEKQRNEIRAKMRPGDVLIDSPPNPMDNWEKYMPRGESCMHYVGGELATAELAEMVHGKSDWKYKQEQIAKATAYRASCEMTEKLLNNPVYLQNRIEFLQEKNSKIISILAPTIKR